MAKTRDTKFYQNLFIASTALHVNHGTDDRQMDSKKTNFGLRVPQNENVHEKLFKKMFVLTITLSSFLNNRFENTWPFLCSVIQQFTL